MNTHQPFIKIAFYSALYSTVLLTPVNATTAPTLNLFPTSVVANLQTSASSAEAMENNLEHIVVKMENQAQLYNDSQCEKGMPDAGCSKIKRDLASTYTQMLDKLSEHLPTMKQAMQSTIRVLGKNIRVELGKKMTPMDLENLVRGKQPTLASKRKLSRQRQGRMSGSLKKFSEMISLSKNQSPTQALLAADIYADAMEALDYVDSLQMSIDQSKIINSIDHLWSGEPSEQMMTTVSSVKALLFGEVETDLIPDQMDMSVEIKNDPYGLDSDY